MRTLRKFYIENLMLKCIEVECNTLEEVNEVLKSNEELGKELTLDYSHFDSKEFKEKDRKYLEKMK